MLRDSLSVCLAVFMVQSLNFVAVCEGAAETWAWFCPIFSLQTLFSDSHAHSLSLMLWHFLFSLRFSPSSFWCFTIRKPVSPQRFQSHGKTALSQLQQPKSSSSSQPSLPPGPCLYHLLSSQLIPVPPSLSNADCHPTFSPFPPLFKAQHGHLLTFINYSLEKGSVWGSKCISMRASI